MKMKFPFPVGNDVRSLISNSRFKKETQPRHLGSYGIGFHPSQRGVALIITLILLAVVTFMAIAFLAMSRRERGAVTTVTDTAGARYAADAALANAEAQIIANALATTNPFNFGLLVSTNYINPAGFNPLAGGNFTNVNYYDSSGNFLTGNNFLINLTNLWYSPRPPVFISTNAAGGVDFRFYLDLNRNGQYDANGIVPNVQIVAGSVVTNGTIFEVGDPEWIGILQKPDAPYGPNNPFVARYAFIAMPVGNTLDLNAIYNQAQRGLPSLPADQTVNPPAGSTTTPDSFIRNEGVGSWEINLAAFLADLNTNQWDPPTMWNPLTEPYQYPGARPGQSVAIDDARALLAYRYNNSFNTLATIGTLPGNLFGNPGIDAFSSDFIDDYSYGQPLLGASGFDLPALDNDSTLIANRASWVGADNTNHYFSHQELFNSNEISAAFVNHLLAAGQTNSTYDRYTFYRLLSQLGTDTAPDSGKMNLNYINVGTNGNVVPGMETNFIPWTNALTFFTNAADRLLRAYTTQWRNSNPTNFAAEFYSVANINSITNASQWTNYPAFGLSGAPGVIPGIPVLVSNRFVYSSAVNRLLQLAANMYDATTNNTFAQGKNYPSVFRPLFSRDADAFGRAGLGTNVFISGYTSLAPFFDGANDYQLALPIDISVLSTTNGPVNNLAVNVYGVPWIIGAKKGFPNFNEFSMESIVWIERKLEITRPSLNAPLSNYQTNQMYFLAISNVLGVECWNSYNSNYTSLSPIQIVARDNLSVTLTNQEPGGAIMSPVIQNNLLGNTVSLPLQGAFYTWPGSAPWTPQQNKPPSPNPGSFDIPWSANIILPLNASGVVSSNGISIYVYQNHNFIPAENLNTTNYVDKGIVPMPQFGLLTTNRLQVFMLDGNHVIDYVQFAGPDSSRNLNAEIADYDPSNPDNGLWNTNFFETSTTPNGVVNQIYYALNPLDKSHLAPNDDTTWRNPPGMGTVAAEVASLNAFLNPNHTGSGVDPNNPSAPAVSATNLNLSVQVTFPAARTAYQYISWQANDPLVHYVASDLNYNGTEASGLQTGTHQLNYATTNLPANNLGQLNDRYQPWGNMLSATNADTNPCNLAYKDPLVRMSDNWDFPTNKFPGVGWLGRVHRGTPWQTVYLKATDILSEYLSPSGINIGTNTWVQWTGDTQLTFGQYFDAINTAPVQDRLLFDLFTTAFNDNATRGTLSVNQDHLAAWSALFSGVVVLTNNAPDSLRLQVVPQYLNPPPSNSWMIIQPAGVAWTNSPLGQLVNDINQTRANTNLFPMQTFTHVGDILSVPQLTVQSPFLNWNDLLQQTNGISDEMYEWLPQQTMSLLRCSSSPRYVIYCYGQALKPAPNGVYTGGSFFGLITNYQVVSEIATRAVVRFNGTLTNVITTNTFNVGGTNLLTGWTSVPVVTNNNAVIESFNILPPD
jgi:hypothetical protein